ncbi:MULTISPECIES: dual specificity protein phosphatase family protein [Shewanella]|uniref:Protein phosphatase n=1 Tax=Shewanella psychromarinicola TaxID=2487742 RepID=A0A3N4E0B9_9GAMM|nr:dual specificity protein phosphatase family protein [Shewanella psychromarinicola]AZG35579.1 protein phosphatase [Shewanella psychromarinicola]MCL1081392.1 dual specificity protein phosphatase family protein [Shewanella psychromarinicola]RPA27671.1 protein phosphatase [Shewanella psychromarinicola]
MKDIFWLVDKQVAGRSGPNKDAWDLAELKQAGFAAIASLNNGEGCDVDAMAELGLRHKVFNLPDNMPPKPQDLAICAEVLPQVLAFIRECESEQKAILLHCSSGINRTQMVMAYYLMENGAAPLHAVSQVRNACGLAFDAEGWDQFVYDVLYELQAASN